jgi:hypothetical protein
MDINENLSPVARRYFEYVKKNNDYYQQPTFVFSRLVERCRNLVNKVHSDNLDVDSPQARALSAIIPEIIRVETELRENRRKAGINSEQLIAMEEVNARRAKLIELLESCRLSVEQKDNSMYYNSIGALIEHFDKMDAEREKHREAIPRSIPEPVINQPRESLKVKGKRPRSVPKGSKNFKSEIPRDSSPFLKENKDVQFTDEITALAAELSNSPVEMYEYVRNNFDFDVYVGSRKGSQQTLDEGAGNDYDLASLLIALLRTSGFYAGYENIEVKIRADRLCNCLGIDDPVKAMELMNFEGFNVYWGQQDTIVIGDWVVVAAYLPDVNYRGAVNDSNSQNWMLLDPAFKQYQYSPAINMLDEITDPFQTDTFMVNYCSELRPETPLEYFRQAMVDTLALYHPGAVYDDLIRTSTVIEETDEILPGTLPYTVASFGSPYPEIPENNRYKVNFLVKRRIDTEHPPQTIMTFATTMPEIAGKQVTVSYKASSPGQQDFLDEAGGIYNYPPGSFYALALVPVLSIDGCEIDVGIVAATCVADLQIFNMCVELEPPDGAPIPMNDFSAQTLIGDYVGIAINTGSKNPVLFDDPENTCDERYAGQVMHQTATSYLNTERAQSGEFRRILHSKSSYGVEVAFLYSDITPFYNDYYPFAIGGYIWGGFYLDAYLPPGYVVSTDSGCSDYRYEYYRLAGANSSLLESRTFENRFNADAVSTIKILQLTYDAGETVCTVYENIYECPYNNHHPDVVEMVNEFIAQGENYVAIIPELQTRYDQWCGTGILLLDTQTGLGGYVIWGKIVGDGNCPNWGRIYETHGGGTVKEWDIEGYPDLFCTYVSEIPPITIDPPSYEDLYCAEREDYLTFTVHGINFLGGPNSQDECETLGHEDVRQFRLPYTIKEIAENPEWGPNVYTFVIGNRAVNGLCGGSCQTAEKSFTIFKVDKLQYESPGGTWNDISDQSPLYVLKGSTVEFKAVPDPEITWPPDTPIWGGSSGANGTGEIVEVTFNAISESLTDYKTVTAGCEIDGTPTTANVIVYDINELASIVPIMIFEGRSLTRYGLDEWIELSFVTIPEGVTYSQAGGVEWSNTGDGTVRDQYGNGEAYYVAPSTNGQDEIRLTIQTGPSSGQHKSYPRTIVAPSGAYMVQQPGSGIWHRQNTCSVGFYGDEYLLPTDVSFWRLQWKEDSCPGIGQGYYEYLNGAIHPPTPEWRAIAGGDIETGCIIIQDQDVVASSEGPPPFEDGTFDWFIPNLIRTHDEVYELLQANHHQIADETGRCTISKLGAGPFSKDSSDPDSDY